MEVFAAAITKVLRRRWARPRFRESIGALHHRAFGRIRDKLISMLMRTYMGRADMMGERWVVPSSQTQDDSRWCVDFFIICKVKKKSEWVRKMRYRLNLSFCCLSSRIALQIGPASSKLQLCWMERIFDLPCPHPAEYTPSTGKEWRRKTSGQQNMELSKTILCKGGYRHWGAPNERESGCRSSLFCFGQCFTV